MRKRGPKRVHIPRDIETAVLVASRRRCCLCFFLDRDQSLKKGQIAHLDHDPSNAARQNLAWLCTPHHDEYDSIPRLTRKITPGEVRTYRERLETVIARQDATVEFPEEKGATPEHSSGRLLGEIIERVDGEIAYLDRYGRPTGLAIQHIARTAIEQEGDFLAARQALLALLRLAGECELKTGQEAEERPVLPHADPVTAAEALLRLFATTDFSLFTTALADARDLAIRGDIAFLHWKPEEGLPRAFGPYALILARLTRGSPTWVGPLLLEEFLGLMLSSGLILQVQNVSLPEPLRKLTLTITGQVHSGTDRRLTPYVRVASYIAGLDDSLLSQLLSKWRYQINGYSIFVRSREATSLRTSKSLMRRHALVPNRNVIIGWPQKNESDAKKLRAFLDDLKRRGDAVAESSRAYITRMRELVITAGDTQKAPLR